MFQGLNLVGRLIAILLILLVALGLFGIGLNWYLRGQETGGGTRLPLPDQVAAIVDIIERGNLARRDLVLRAVNSDEFKVTITSARPPASAGQRMPVAEWLVANYLEALPTRAVEVLVLREDSESWFLWLVRGASPKLGLPLRIVVPLTTGEFAIFETRGAAVQRVFGVPIGFWIGVLGTILGAIAIVAIRREAKPLADLSHALHRFGSDARPHPVTPRGAPDVRALIDAVNAMQTRIAALLKGRTILLGAVSHDLKTYITRLRFRIEAIDDETQRTKAALDLEEMTALIDGAIAVAKGGAAIELRERVDLAALVSREVEARDRERMKLSANLANPIVMGDAVGLRRVVTNVLDNAMRYGGRAEIEVRRSNGMIEIVVDDPGPGIPPDDREAIFEPFYRGEPSRNRSTGGSGLGLAIARQIVEAHGGRIGASASPAGGARITIEIPRAG
jgi:signal transduction histidine kinase